MTMKSSAPRFKPLEEDPRGIFGTNKKSISESIKGATGRTDAPSAL
jgi:hypothetical protein